MSDSPIAPTLTYSETRISYEKNKDYQYSYFWKTRIVKTYQITTYSTYLTSTKELIGENKHKRLISVVIGRTRENLDSALLDYRAAYGSLWPHLIPLLVHTTP
ncbi:hypothetical protein PGT21_003515 [Puccinia graminis f. sp. tritici]|uniref:Uncharacterized protein n=1 Tax=Puccinia graminis f. sp. tritici TaxID=56615 RepID=A0A5B0NA55_PUCGR|nr:hypothetical protein PGT21_003515 [Puccinia graminis f. sp. tritici]